ncbi:MAG TPA: hypothetical protein VF145_10605 [Chitinophagaceae bacterium]
MKPIFIKVSPINVTFTYYVNAALIEMMFQSEKDKSTSLFFSSSPSIKVKETPEQIRRLIEDASYNTPAGYIE